MELESYYEISSTADYIRSRNFTRVALQFPDELLKDSTRVASALRNKLSALGENVRFFVMADTTYGSCCVDEVAASHINAECVIHYGHTCLSSTSVLPAYFVFGKAVISVSDCVEHLLKYAASGKPILVLYDLGYSHAMRNLNEALMEAHKSSGSGSSSEILFADVVCSVMDPLNSNKNSNDLLELARGCFPSDSSVTGSCTKYSIGGLIWNLPNGQKMEDYLLFWVGSDNSAFSNVVLTFGGCEIVRYDATENQMVTDFTQQRRILKRRYYLVEKAKDANMIGILVGTLGVAGYLHMIHQMKELIAKAGKKAYTLVMGRPNPAKLANFPECDVFIYVSCAQTALLDSKEFLAPVITPFEAMLAFNRGSQWTGSYVMEFRDLINSSSVDLIKQTEEPRYSFFQGGYVEDLGLQGTAGDKEDALALSDATEKVLQLNDKHQGSLVKGSAKSVAEFFAARSYQGLELHSDDSLPEPYLIGRSGKASGYKDEKSKEDIF